LMQVLAGRLAVEDIAKSIRDAVKYSKEMRQALRKEREDLQRVYEEARLRLISIRVPTPSQAAPSGPVPPSAPAQSSLAGGWSFVCCDNRYKLNVNLIQTQNRVSGSFSDGTEIEGTVNGQSIRFTRKTGGGNQNYELTLSADNNTLTGSFTGFRNETVGTDVVMRRAAGQ
jgi:hypothetical protein